MNIRSHTAQFHPTEEVGKPAAVATSSQRTIKDALGKLPPTSQKAKRITKGIAEFIAMGLQPYSVVENRGFRRMMEGMEPRYVIPSQRYFTNTAVPALKQTKAEIVSSLLNADRVAVTCDVWTSVATESFVTVTVHFITDEWELKAHVLQTRAMHESHMGANMAELLSSAVNKWDITKKEVVVVTDNAAIMVVSHLKCYAHTLNLAAQRALKVPSVARLLGRVRRIGTFFHRSTVGAQQLEESQRLLNIPKHKLKVDCCTRWISAFEMVSRFLEQQPAITATLLSPQKIRERPMHTQ
ncbi:Zinc finger BED domain-containing protein 4 [Larimichthys crocea]|uniref:Zinc finger BED domain-containing protein 4 n=1 Tax=Larimichthys crocea TaxID=215358 RepID=A0A6G0IA99_LARCR|nr:Zinc finger BED domain-containing protein 4 [Larimichthys crocea]